MVAGKKEGSKAYQAEEFLLEFKDREHATEDQTLAQIESSIKTWVAAANIQHRREKKMAPKSAA
jgi:hypothetical protein